MPDDAAKSRTQSAPGADRTSLASSAPTIAVSATDLRESEERYRSLVELSPDAILILDAEQIVYCNTAATALFGAPSAEALLGRPVGDFLSGAERLSAVERIGAILATGQPAPPRLYHVVRLDGQALEVESRGGRCRFHGRPAVQVVVRDVTERRRIEEALRRNEAHLRAIIDTEPECLKLVTPDGILLQMNNAGLAMVEAERAEDLLGKCVLDLIVPDHREPFRDMCQRVAAGAKDKLEFEIVGLRGTRRWMQSHGVRLPQRGDESPVLVFVTRDITEAKRAEEALRQSEERYRRLVEASPFAILVADLHANITYCNQQLAELMGCREPAELVGRNGFSMVALADRERASQAMQTTLAQGQLRDFEFTALRLDGASRIVDASVSVMLGSTGEPIGFMIVVRDVTARKQAEEERQRLETEMRQAQKLKSIGVLAGGIAHDFNNLLTPILCCTRMAADALPPASSTAPLLDEVERAARRAAELVAQLLAYAGKGKFVTTVIDLSELVHEMAQLLKTSISRKAEMQLQMAPSLPAIVGDAAQLRQVVMNLITNASDALSEAPGRIIVRTGFCPKAALPAAPTDTVDKGHGCVFFEVADTGVGMAAETQALIFEPFYSTKFTGRGLGLAAVQGIVRGHHGAISVKSELGKGSTFRVMLPCRAEAALPAAAPAPPSSRWQGAGTVLLVEDEDFLRLLARRILTGAGFRVLEAGDGQQGVDVFRAAAAEIAVVVLDLTMPRLNGLEAFAQMRQIAPGVRVVVMSGYSAHEVTKRFQNQGLAGFVHKPFTADELLQAVRQALPQS